MDVKSYGYQKINLHQLGNEFEPKAGNVSVGSADLCFILKTSINEAQQPLLNVVSPSSRVLYPDRAQSVPSYPYTSDIRTKT